MELEVNLPSRKFLQDRKKSCKYTKVFVLRSNNMYLENVVCILGEKYTKPLVPNQQQKHTQCVEMKFKVAFIFSQSFASSLKVLQY